MSTKLSYFDAHTHMNLAAYAEDYREVIRRALTAGVGMINVGTERGTSRRALEIAHEFGHEPIYAAVGLHPIHTGPSFHDAGELGSFSYSLLRVGTADGHAHELERVGEDFDREYYRKLAENPKVVAIGECGLDYFHLPEGAEEEAKQKQKDAFVAQVELAHEVGKPLMIHCRNAYSDLIGILNTYYSILNTKNPGIIHFFAGTVDEAKQFLDLGFSFTFGGAITFPPKKTAPVHPDTSGVVGDYAAIIRMLPLDRILSETDAPYVAPVPHRGKRNEPAYVIETVKKLAEIKGVSLEEMAHATVENARRILKLDRY